MRRTRLLITAAAVLVTVAGGLTATSRHDTAHAAVVWNEDFNDVAGAGVDPSKWNLEEGNGDNGWGNQEVEFYQKGTSNAVQDGQGHLVITARKGSAGHNCWNGPCGFTSARMQTAGKFQQMYGHVE